MARRLKLAGGSAAFALVIPLLAAGGSTAAGSWSVASTAKLGARCKLTAVAPTEVNDHIADKASIRCKTSRTVHMHIEIQMREQGQWGTFGSFDGDVHVRARRTRCQYGPG